MLLFRRNDLPVLYPTYDCGYSDCVWCAGCLEAEKNHRYTNSSLPALKLEIRAHIHGKGDKKYAHHGAGRSYFWRPFPYLYFVNIAEILGTFAKNGLFEWVPS